MVTHLTRLPLIVTAAMLSCLLCGCDPKALDHSLNVLSGKSDAEPQAFLAIEPSSVEVAAVAVETVTPPCVPGTGTYMNRFFLYDSCTHELIGPDPRYW